MLPERRRKADRDFESFSALELPIPLVQPGSLDRGRDHLSEIRQNCLIDAAEVTVVLVREFERSNGAAVKSREHSSD